MNNFTTGYVNSNLFRTSYEPCQQCTKCTCPYTSFPFSYSKEKRCCKSNKCPIRSPRKELLKLLKDYIKSVLFAASYLGILGPLLCYFKHIVGDVNGKYVIPPAAFLSGIALLFEHASRRQEISLFLVPKVMEAFYLLAERRGLVSGQFKWSHLVFGIAMAIICFFYQNSKGDIKASYLSAFQLILGDV